MKVNGIPFYLQSFAHEDEKGFRHPTRHSLQKLFRLAASSIGFNWSPALLRRVHSLHKAGISYNRKKERIRQIYFSTISTFITTTSFTCFLSIERKVGL